ncbi:MAG: hypothetical protein KF708_04270 [Pirellulales bacterium]|nr:hypothetical protein [Pirellulales bacterium]
MMQGFDTSTVLWCLGTIQALGLASAAFARWSEGRTCQTPVHWLFFAFLGLVGVGTVAAMMIGPGCGLVSGTTLALMALTATLDLSRVGQASHSH